MTMKKIFGGVCLLFPLAASAATHTQTEQESSLISRFKVQQALDIGACRGYVEALGHIMNVYGTLGNVPSKLWIDTRQALCVDASLPGDIRTTTFASVRDEAISYMIQNMEEAGVKHSLKDDK